MGGFTEHWSASSPEVGSALTLPSGGDLLTWQLCNFACLPTPLRCPAEHASGTASSLRHSAEPSLPALGLQATPARGCQVDDNEGAVGVDGCLEVVACWLLPLTMGPLARR